ncbi:alpha-amylase family glycosyl hydrolase [Planctobacterium marinum]|uniref:alpha-amylase family glycosyl hydrolase n=1 Tax=Planctobacterium marinum TaxID=1631968 RepID=UPI001E353069|nr:alpha-amylase family glycosyl hydrolase [Planctobacterium marinum]MCC2606719.1 alpha-amylase [Planctobacterium marinum]
MNSTPTQSSPVATCLLLSSIILLLATINKSWAETPDFWRNATVYFLLTDRFSNGDPGNDASYQRHQQAALLRGFEGGDIKGITQQIEAGYFNRLGVDAIWTTPVIEQIHGFDVSDRLTYAYHGYWPKDWTAVDANFGSEADLAAMIKAAHKQGIRVLVDVIINHTGPKTEQDQLWPANWVRTEPLCNWTSYQQNVSCALATSLTDIKTESEQEVELPEFLLEKWRQEGRLDTELAELSDFFQRTGYPKAPKYYLVKWLTDWVREYGIDGFRVDTAKHVEPEIWAILKKESELALAQWRTEHPDDALGDLPFYMVGEVFNWGVAGFKSANPENNQYNYGDKQVQFFDFGFDALINMGFVSHISQDTESLFSQYSAWLQAPAFKGKGILNYIGSHDDQDSWDRSRAQIWDSAFKLMMAPGGVQIYYGDELARPMLVEDAFGDAGLRANMNWQDLTQPDTQALLRHWQRLGQFRQRFPAVGAGQHQIITAQPYVFSRTLANHKAVVVGADLKPGNKALPVADVFTEGTLLQDHYSGQQVRVKEGQVFIDSPWSWVLLGE